MSDAILSTGNFAMGMGAWVVFALRVSKRWVAGSGHLKPGFHSRGLVFQHVTVDEPFTGIVGNEP